MSSMTLLERSKDFKLLKEFEGVNIIYKYIDHNACLLLSKKRDFANLYILGRNLHKLSNVDITEPDTNIPQSKLLIKIIKIGTKLYII